MSHDVEIIEDDEVIIELSDEEDCKVVSEIVDLEEFVQESHTQFNVNKGISPEGSTKELVMANKIKKESNKVSTNSQNGSNVATSISHSFSKSSKPKTRQSTAKRRKHFAGAVSKETSFNNWRLMNTVYDFSKLKWLKPLCNLESPPHLQLVIVDRNHPYWRIENDKWLMVEKRLLEALNTEIILNNDPSIGLFDGAKWQRGVKIVGCHNQNAFNFIMEFVTKLDKLWNGAQLDAFPITRINQHVVKAYIPPPTIKTELIMSLIKLQNPWLNTADWKVLQERERAYNSGLDIWLSVNDQSFTQLSSVRGEIKFGINRIFLSPSS